MDIGQEVVPILEDAWDFSYNAVFQDRVENIIHEIHFEELKQALIEWRDDPQKELLYGAYLVSKYQYPSIVFEDIEEQLAQLSQDIWIEMNPKFTALEKIKLINRIFFGIHGFSGNRKKFYSPQNSYIHQVLEMKKGNPISLSLIYLELANRLKIPVYGVNLPQHFVLAYTQLPIEYLEKPKREDILFYINTFNNGSLFKAKEIEKFLQQLKIESKEQYFLPCDSVSIIKRFIKNLAYSYSQIGDQRKVSELKELINCLAADKSYTKT